MRINYNLLVFCLLWLQPRILHSRCSSAGQCRADKKVPNSRLGPKFDQSINKNPAFASKSKISDSPSDVLEKRIGTLIGTASHCCNLMCTSPILWPSISTGHYTDYRIGNVVTQGSNKVLFFVWLREPRLFGPSHTVEGCFFISETLKRTSSAS